MKKHLALKIIVALLPAALFTQNWAWMTGNKIIGIAFLILWASMVWYVIDLEDKNRILEKLIRALEIGFFLLPISALILTFIVGSQVADLTDNEFAQAGAAVGTAIGGIFAVGASFVIGFFGGIISHLIANKYEKKAGHQSHKELEGANFFQKHKALTIVMLMITLVIIASVVSVNKEVQKNSIATDNKVKQETKEPEKPKEPSPVEIIKATVTKNTINTPVANISVKNIADKDIDAIKVRISTFNNFDEPVNGFLSDNTFEGISQEEILAGANQEFSWALYDFDGTTKIKPTVYSVHFKDGSSWSE